MNDAPYHHGNLRDALIDAALVVIREQGAGAVSLRALARDLGVSHAAPARHFPTRDALFAAIAERGYRNLAARVAEVRTVTGDPLQRLRLMARANIDWVRSNPALYAAMRNPEVMRHSDALLQQRMRAFAIDQMSFVKAAKAAGWRGDEPAEVTMLSIVGGLTGIATILTDAFLTGVLAPVDPDRLTDALIDRILAP
jgi:AcrR family transcriptional regulator